jgi:pimeloyl-ACP methyl ester carboxylesterase
MKVLLPGVPTTETQARADGSHAFFEDIAQINVKHAREVAALGRAGEPQTEVLVEVAPGDVVELEFEGGIRQWISVAQLKQDMERSGQRSAELGGVPIPLQPIGAPADKQSRDIAAWVLKGLKVLGIDPVAKTADLAERQVIERFEEKLNPPSGLYSLDGPTAVRKAITAETQFDASGPALIFLHGTASSISGSFGHMAGTWDQLSAHYPGRIYGFQHKTLSVSPVTNVLALAKLLPRGATLHLVSHSRGGLVGELLCIREISERQLDAFRLKARRRDSEAKIEPAEREDRENAREAESAALKELSDLLKERQFKIERFVRVACPARGTILASGRLDLYLSLATSVIGLAIKNAPFLQPIHDFMKAVTIEIARRRTRPEGLPGLEAQMPESPLIHLLNNTGLESQADLAVIAGDIQVGDGVWRSLGVLATNLFYLERHDLVVNTEAMYAGMTRARGTWFFFDQGSGVSHFNYFQNQRTRDRLLSWLGQPTGQNIDPAFQLRVREAGSAATSRSAGGRDTAGLPTLFVLPGIMGTRLKDSTGLVWLDQQRLSVDGIAPLAIEAAGVETDGIVKLGYQRLEQHFAATYNVVLFAYDWRRSVADAADRLAAEVEARHKTGNLVRIIAHSMGGLVARAMIARHPELWKTICTSGGRLLQLGTPNKGSFTILRLLWGVESMVQMLEMLDPRQTKQQICETLVAYPGVLDMLPETTDGRFFDASWWSKDHGQLASPSPAELRRVDALRSTIASGDKTAIVYVAGASDATPANLSFEESGPVWETTVEGDGTVPDALGFIAGVPVYYADAVHGDLANQPAAFDGFAEILAMGATSKLPQQRRAGTRAIGSNGVLRGLEPVLFPTEEELLAAALGMQRRRRTQQRTLPPLNVAVHYGDLRRARFPLVVGHYQGDKIVNAEATLDAQLESRLSRRAALGLYPGAEGTCALILAPNRHPPGALIVGLGNIGEISMEKVRRGVMDAALRYGVHLAEEARNSSYNETNIPSSTGLAVLLLGTNGGHALRVTDSVAALVLGVLDANRALGAERQTARICFDALNIVELYEVVATQALYAARRLAQRLRDEREGEQEVVVAPFVQPIGNGRFQPPLNQYETGWWPRIEITAERGTDNEPTGHLRFSIPTSRAGIAELITGTQTKLIDALVAQAIASPSFDLTAVSNLFELLVPNNLKPRLDVDADNAIVLVDSSSAHIPWEVLARRMGQKIDFLGLRMGLVRQFKSTALQQRQPDSRSLKAVVIGDTENPYAPLPGAVEEAEAVAKVLERRGYTPQLLKRPDFYTGLGAVLSPDYRILHIAAHGLYDSNLERPSGVVLGQGKNGEPMFLTSREFRQMPAMPELVFLNCCHLGKTDKEEEQRSHHDRLRTINALAASVAEELINKGVKVVVAAGWAVNDAAANVFAKAFYSQMLDGQCFGDAVLYARRTTKQQYPDVNTWAAYQCYGSPDYTLEGDGDFGKQSATPAGVKYTFGSRTEFLHAVRSLRGEVTDGRTRTDKSAVRADLETLTLSIPSMWRDGEMLYELGMIWGELGDFAKAVPLLTEALGSEEALAPFDAAEQLANFEDRWAAQEAMGAGVSEEVAKRWARAQDLIEKLLGIAKTRERWSLLAACKKRRAQFATGDERRKLFAAAADDYRRAYQLSVDAHNPDPYPGLNWLTHAFLFPDNSKLSEKELVVTLEKLREAIELRLQTEVEKEIWIRVHRADALLLHHLINGDLHSPAASGRSAAELVKEAYRDVFQAGATQREVSSVSGQIGFIINALTKEGATLPNAQSVLTTLEDIRTSIS